MWLEIAGPANRAVPVNAITWKNVSPVSRDPGIVMPGSRLTGLIFFHVIANLIFGVFLRRAGTSAKRASPPNRASPAHVIGPLVPHAGKLFHCKVERDKMLKVMLDCFAWP